MLKDYLSDMSIAIKYAKEIRKSIGETIIAKMDLHPVSSFTTIHNYTDTENKILRKGSVSAKSGELIIIPINNFKASRTYSSTEVNDAED